MIRQIKKVDLPEELFKKASSKDAVIYVIVKPEDRVKTRGLEGSDDVTYVKCPIIKATKDSMFMALTKEKSPAGSLIVKAMWAGKTVDVLLETAGSYDIITLYPDRLSISGGIFEELLHEYRVEDKSRDFAAVWEMSFDSVASLSEKPFGRYTEDVIDFFEMHYDNPAMKA